MELRTLVMVWAIKSVGDGEEVKEGEEGMGKRLRKERKGWGRG